MKRGIYYFTLPPEDGKETIYPNGCKHFFYIQAKNVCTLICQSYSTLTKLYVPHDIEPPICSITAALPTSALPFFACIMRGHFGTGIKKERTRQTLSLYRMPDKAPAHKLPFLKGEGALTRRRTWKRKALSPSPLSPPKTPSGGGGKRRAFHVVSHTRGRRHNYFQHPRGFPFSPPPLFRLSFALESSFFQTFPFPSEDTKRQRCRVGRL